MLALQMTITHTFTPGIRQRDRVIPGREHTHIDLTRTLWIRTPEGARHARAFEIIPGCSQTTPMAVRTTNPDGTTRINEVPHAARLIVGPRNGSPAAYTLAFPHPEPGSVITFRYRMTCDGLLPFDRFELHEAMPVRRVEYTLNTYRAADIAPRQNGMHLDTTQHRYGRTTWRWTATHIPPRPPEPGMATPPPDPIWASYVLHRAGRVPYLQDWTPILRGPEEMSHRLAPQVHRTLGGLDRPPTAPIATAWDIMHRALLDAELPHPPREPTFADAHRRRRSGASGRALALHALLANWKIACDLIYTTPHGAPPIERMYPYGARNSTLLLRCGDQLLDPSCPGCAPGELHPLNRGRPAIALTHSRGELDPSFITLPDPSDPPIERALTLTLDPRGLRIDATATLRGHRAATLREQLRDHRPTAPRDQQLRHAITPALTSGHTPNPDLDPQHPLRLTTTAARTDRDALARTADRVLITPAALLPARPYELLELPDRQRPLRIDPHDGYTDRVTLTLPPGATLAHTPADATLTTPHGTWRRTLTPTDGALTLTETLELTPATIPPERWPELRAFLTAADTARREPIVLAGVR